MVATDLTCFEGHAGAIVRRGIMFLHLYEYDAEVISDTEENGVGHERREAHQPTEAAVWRPVLLGTQHLFICVRVRTLVRAFARVAACANVEDTSQLKPPSGALCSLLLGICLFVQNAVRGRTLISALARVAACGARRAHAWLR